MAEEKHFSSIQFIRLMDLLRLGDGEKVSRSEYLRLVPTCRKQLMSSKFIDANFDVERELQRNPDTRTSYESYFARISEDLCWAKGFDPAIAADPDLYAAEVSKVAKTMIKRLVVRITFPLYQKLLFHDADETQGLREFDQCRPWETRSPVDPPVLGSNQNFHPPVTAR